jgi:FOG: LysM repeat
MSNYDDGEFFEYTIQAGDTLWNLADEYDISIEEIIDANADLDPNNLYVGQVIYLPGDLDIYASQRPGRRPVRRSRPRPYACRQYYLVQPGDSLYRISYQFGVPVRSIIAANPYVNFGYALQVGQSICIPYR